MLTGGESSQPSPRTNLTFRNSLAASVLFLFVTLLLLWANAYSPGVLGVRALQVSTILFLLSCAVATEVGFSRLWRDRVDLRFPIIFITVLILIVLSLHFYTISVPATQDCIDKSKGVFGCIMDEVYYVPASQNILSGMQCAPYADNCNLEHPFLGKAFVAAGIATFGLTDFGWRFFQVILGTASIPLLFALVLKLSGDRRMAYYSALLLAADTMFFVHSGAALIDVQPVFFALAAFLLYFLNLRFWKIDSYLLAGVFMGLAGLSKETAIFLFAALLSYHTLFSKGGFRDWVFSSLKIVLAAGAVFAAGLQIYGSLYATAAFPTFFQDVRFILNYGSGLLGSGWTDPLFNAPITPLNWITFYSPVAYLVTHVTTTVTVGSAQTQSVYTDVGYYGITNMLVVWMVFAWVPLVLYETLKTRGAKNEVPEPPSRSRQTAVFAFIWFAWTYLPYLALWGYGRVTYPFYFVPAIPALAIGASYFVSRSWFSQRMAMVYLLAAFGWFFLFYSDKAFLPIWLRVLLGK
jgi:4-amino-4-deoxy-L-arabinose transferase-like glycosyltransferase